ncbi:unnamed protein product [Periconia digitata]|uniref:Rhodopsin domain-containing protein n=1 Tax=Periconia digitata TaxID=1303443 RepID=A0A9W4UTS1_9PLEO|nr:unnamed protein product [Periconia digitata]
MASDGIEFPINGGTYAPYGTITRDNHGSYVIIATWIFACISTLFVAVRVALRTWTSRHFGPDSALIVIALLFAIAQGICDSEAVRSGLGRHYDTLNGTERPSYNRTIFASEILSVFVFVLVKLSMMALIAQITPSHTMAMISRWFTVFTILWGIAYVFSASFQCGARVPMRAFENACVDHGGLLYTHGVINILTDAFIALLPIFIVWKVQIPKQKRILVMGLFWVRILVCIAAGIRLGTLEPYLSKNDVSWYYLWPTMWNQITIHLSIITACVPSIKPFFDALQSSLIDSGIPRNYKSNNSIELRPWKSSYKTYGSRSSRKLQSSLGGLGITSTVHNEIGVGAADDQTSTASLTNNVIHQQRDVDVVIAEASEVRRGPIMFNRGSRT